MIEEDDPMPVRTCVDCPNYALDGQFRCAGCLGELAEYRAEKRNDCPRCRAPCVCSSCHGTGYYYTKLDGHFDHAHTCPCGKIVVPPLLYKAYAMTVQISKKILDGE